MNRKRMLNGALSAILMLAMITLAACSGGKSNDAKDSGGSPAATNEQNASSSASPSGSEGGTSRKEPVTLSVLFNSTDKDFEKTDVYQEIIKQTGVTLEIEKYDEEKFKVQLAGGDLPDIIQVPDKYLKQLIEGNNIIPLDELVNSNGPDLLKPVYEQSLQAMRDNRSNDTGKLYLIPIQIGQGDYAFKQDVGFVTRWDYYKELGYPDINNYDDMVNILAEMVKNHPTTADGKKIYGVSMWNDWGLWGLESFGLINGMGSWGKGHVAAWDTLGKTYYNQYTDPEHSAVWDTAYFLNKSNRAGILDPDAFTDKYSDIEAKAMQGTLLYGPATWPFDKPNAELLKQQPDAGYMPIPLDWGYAYAAGNRVTGWGDKWFAITKNCENPERAMDLINFIASEQGSRLIASGIQGVHWDVVDGKPQLKDEIIQLKSAGGDPWKKTGIGMMTNQQGIGDSTVLSDGGLTNLFNSAEAYANQLTTLDEDYSEHYGVAYPGEIYKKYTDEGKIVNNNARPWTGLDAMQDLPEDLKFISKKLDDMITKGIPQIVLNAKSDEEYKAMQQQLIEDLKKEGADKVYDYNNKEYERVKPLIKY